MAAEVEFIFGKFLKERLKVVNKNMKGKVQWKLEEKQLRGTVKKTMSMLLLSSMLPLRDL